MQFLYGARFARWGLLKCISMLARRVASWTVDCDADLHRLVAYVHTYPDLILKGWIAQDVDAKALTLTLFGDADFAGERPGYKSTIGAIQLLEGHGTIYIPWPPDRLPRTGSRIQRRRQN